MALSNRTGRWSKQEHRTMMCIALGRGADDVGCIKLDQYSIQKVLGFCNYAAVAQVLNRTPIQCRSHWQKVKKKLKQTLYTMKKQYQQHKQLQQLQQLQQRQREEREINRAAFLLLNLSNRTLF